MAKGRLLGIQFDTLFTDDLYFKIAAHADKLAMKLKNAFLEKGYKMYFDSYTNQQYPILSKKDREKLAQKYQFSFWEQIDEAFQFVLRNIHLGATIVGIYRQDIYEIPPDAIRELIVNAMVHRSYLDHDMIQVAVYDNRLEITSPGKLPMGQTLERMKEGYSKIRNEALAHAFSYMNLIEHWGSGIPRIIEKVKAAGLREPEFIGGEVDLRINIYRGQVDDTVDINDRSTAVKMPLNRRKTADKVPVNEQEQQIYKYVLENVGITTTQAMELLGIKQRRTREILGKMVESGWLKKEGASRSTVYVKNTEVR